MGVVNASIARIRFTIPAGLYIYGEAAWTPTEHTFDAEKTAWRIVADIGHQFKIEDNLDGEVTHINGLRIFSSLAYPRRCKREQLESFVFEHVIALANRISKAFRYNAYAPLATTFSAEMTDVFLDWDVQISRPSQKWDKLRLWPLFRSPLKELTLNGHCPIQRWESVIEAIAEDRPPRLEEEFVANANEHLERGNLRLAVLETVIALELAIGKYLQTYLRIHQSIPDKEVKNTIGPDLPISKRIQILRGFLPSTEFGTTVPWQEVTKLIEVRNKIIHRFGDIPASYDLTEVKDWLTAGGWFALRIGRRIIDWENHPWRRALESEVNTLIPWGTVKIKYPHRNHVRVTVSIPRMPLFLKKPPAEPEMKADIDIIIAMIVRTVSAENKYFRVGMHLELNVVDDSGNVLYSFQSGRWN